MVMNKTRYNIIVNIKTIGGYVEIAYFQLTGNAEEATTIFSNLQGNADADPNAKLRLDLVEWNGKLGLILTTLDCTLHELSENIKYLTKELFRIYNLDRH
jgi:hypothetical protein